MSNNNLSFIDNQVFEPVKETLITLNLANNKLRILNVDALNILNLTEIDLSGNNWLCDKNILRGKMSCGFRKLIYTLRFVQNYA